MSFAEEFQKLRRKRLAEQQEQKRRGGTVTALVKETRDIGTELGTALDSAFANTGLGKMTAADQGLQRSFNMMERNARKSPLITRKQESSGWFQGGAFSDGYQFGDVTKTILGSATDVGENLGTGIIGMGEKALDALMYLGNAAARGQYYQNGGGYNIQVDQAFEEAHKQSTKATEEFIKKDLYDEEAIAKAIISAPIKKLTGIDAETDSVFGKKSDAVIQSGGQLLGQTALQAAGVPWWVTSMVTSFGGETENALNQGASFEEAGVSGLITAGAEVLTEKISGGIKFGGKTLDEALTKQLSRNIANKTVRTLAKLGLDITGEGAEEVLSGYMSAIGQKLTYAGEKELNELFSSEDAWEAFIGGAALGGLAGGFNAVKSNKNGADYASGMTNNEKTVVDKVYKGLVAEAEKNGKISQKEKSKIYDSVLNGLEKGYLSIDDIEEALGGDTYQSYKDTVASEDAILKEFDTLQKMKQGEMTGEQIDRREELRGQVQDIKKNAKRDQLKKQLGQEVFSLVQGDRLAESYNERTRRSQTFQADLSQYEEKYRSTVQRAMDSGILNNSNRTHEFVDLIAKVSADKGISFDFTNNERLRQSGFALEGKTVNGYVSKDGITLNIQSAKALNSVVGHEITHVLEGTELYNQLQSAIVEYAESKGEYQRRYDALAELYKGVKDADVDAELTADLVGDYLFTDEKFVRQLCAGNRNLFQKVFDEIKYLFKAATAGSKEARMLEKVKKTFEQVYRANSQAPGNLRDTKNTAQTDGVRYSIGETTDGRIVAIVDNDILRDMDTTTWDDVKKADAKKAAEAALRQFRNGIVVDGITRKVNRTSRREYTGSQYTEALYRHDKAAFADKMRVADIADDIVIATTNWSRDGGLRHPRKDNIVDFDHGTTLIVSGSNKYVAEVLIGITDTGDAILYDVVGMTPATFDIKETESPTTATTQNAIGDILGDSATDNVTQNSNGVNTKKSISRPGEVQTTQGNWHISGKDVQHLAPIREDLAPVMEDIAPVRSDIPRPVQDGELAPIRKDIPQTAQVDSQATAKGVPTVTGGVAQTAGADVEIDLILGRKIKALEAQVADKNAFIKGKAKELYEELKGLKKGVRASEGLGYLLDYGYEWRQIKTALLNTANWPAEIVDSQSAMESIVREHLNELYGDKVYELDELRQRAEVQKTRDVPERYRTLQKQMEGLETELEHNRMYMQEALAGYDREIADLEARYAAKKNKNTKAANDLLRSIERKKRLRGSVEASYRQRIETLENRLTKMESPAYQRALRRMEVQEAYTTEMEGLIGDTTTWVDKKLGLSYKVNTLRRNLRDVIRDADGNRDIKKADAIYDALQGRYNQNEAKLNRESNAIKKPYMDLKITAAEDAYIQMLGELRHNPDTKLMPEAVEEYYRKHKSKIDTEKVEKVILMARETYDSLLVRVNEVLRAQGMKEIPYRQGYFPHFTEEKQGWLGKLLNWKTQNTDIPTDIAGMTENFNPNRSWQSFNKERKGDTTDYSFTKGMDTYVQGALDWIYHIDDIQRRRAFENQIRYIHSEKGIQDRIDAIRSNEEYDAEEMQERIDLVYQEAKNPLNNFVTDLRAGTNTLAKKKSSMDRGMEEMVNRKAYSTMTNLSNRVSANMVVGSVSSALTNFIPITQSWGQVSPVSSLKAMGDTIRSTFRDDGTVAKSAFLTNRLRGSENLYKTTWDKVSDKLGLLMEGIDGFTSQTVWRSKYLENLSAGMSENEAIRNADQFAENVMAGRSRGNMPTIFDSKNPVIKMLTAFQLEVNNQYGYMFKDMPQDMKNESAGKLVKGYATMFIGAYAYNALYSALVGRDAAFDPIGILEDLLRDMGVFGEDDEEEPADTILNLTDNILDELPFVSGLTGGGRVPISAAMPYDGLYEALTGTVTDASEGNWKKLTKEWLNPVTYLLPPVGGGQIKKTIEGLSMFDDDFPIAGSYTDSGGLRFPVEKTPGSVLQAGLFGQWASQNARDYFDKGWKPLNEKQTQEFMDVGMTFQDYHKYLDGLKGLTSLSEKFDYIDGLDLTNEQKNILVNNLVNRDTPVDMTGYGDYSGYEEFDYFQNNPEKYGFLQSSGIGYEGYKNADEDRKAAYDWAYKNQEKYAVYSAVTGDFYDFYQYSGELTAIKSDVDEKGNTVTGSRKKKVIDYLNGMDVDYGTKIILFKSQYEADDTYNQDIIDYLQNREDLSDEQRKAVLEYLGFSVDAKGNITWED